MYRLMLAMLKLLKNTIGRKSPAVGVFDNIVTTQVNIHQLLDTFNLFSASLHLPTLLANNLHALVLRQVTTVQIQFTDSQSYATCALHDVSNIHSIPTNDS